MDSRNDYRVEVLSFKSVYGDVLFGFAMSITTLASRARIPGIVCVQIGNMMQHDI